jgi:hypothetical protein
MGSGLSPNGLPFSDEGVLSLALLDRQAGCHAVKLFAGAQAVFL